MKNYEALVEAVKAFRQFMDEKYKGEEIRCPYIKKMFSELDDAERKNES